MKLGSILLGSMLLCLGAVPAHAAISFVSASATACAQATAASTHTCTLAASTVTGNTVIVGVAIKTTTSTLTSVTSSPACQFFIRAKPYANGTNDAIQFAVAQNCPALTSVTANLSATSVFEMGAVEYSGVSSIGLIANTSTTGNSTTPSQSITIQDANNFVVMMSGSIGSNGIPTSGTGNLRSNATGRTGATASDAALGIVDNTASSGSVTGSDTITSSQWSAVAIELRTANPADPLLVDEVSTSCDCGTGQPAGNDWVVYFPQPVLSGNAMVCGIIYDFNAGRTITLSDSTAGSNTWTVDKTANGTNQSVSIFHSTNMAAGTAWVKVHFDATLPNYQMQAACKEVYHMATTSEVDASAGTSSSGTGPNITSGSLTTTVDNDLVFEFVGDDINAGIVNIVDGTQVSPSIVPGSGFSPIALDVVTGMCFQNIQQATHGAINPSCDVEDATNNYSAVAVAYKTDNTKGTAPPASGFHIFHQYTFVELTAATVRTVNFPAQANFIGMSGTNNGGSYTITDSRQNAYSIDTRQSSTVNFAYAPAASVDASLMISINPVAGINEYVFYDIQGAKTTSSIACQTPVTGSGTQPGPFTDPQTISNIPTITPCAANDMIVWAMQNGCGPVGNLSSPSGAVTDVTWNLNQSDGSREDFGEGHGHYFTVGTSAVNFNAVMHNNSANCADANGYNYGAWEISAAPSTGKVCTLSLLGAGPC